MRTPYRLPRQKSLLEYQSPSPSPQSVSTGNLIEQRGDATSEGKLASVTPTGAESDRDRVAATDAVSVSVTVGESAQFLGVAASNITLGHGGAQEAADRGKDRARLAPKSALHRHVPGELYGLERLERGREGSRAWITHRLIPRRTV
jgi:hypothetical protein